MGNWSASPPAGHFFGSLQQRLDLRSGEWVLAAAGQFAEVAIGDGTGVFDQPHGAEQGGWEWPAGDREIFDRPLRLRRYSKPTRELGRLPSSRVRYGIWPSAFYLLCKSDQGSVSWYPL